MQLAMLKQLLSKSLLTEKDYNLIKSRLMKDYKFLLTLQLNLDLCFYV